MVVPVPMPEGMSYAGVFGGEEVGFAMNGVVNGPIVARSWNGPVTFMSGVTNGISGTMLATPTPQPPAVMTFSQAPTAIYSLNATATPTMAPSMATKAQVPAWSAASARHAITPYPPAPMAAPGAQGPVGPAGAVGALGPPGNNVQLVTGLADFDFAANDQEMRRDRSLAAGMLGWNQSRLAEAQQALQQAQALQQQGKTEAALPRQLAYCLDQAYRAFNSGNDGGLSIGITNELEQLSDAFAVIHAKEVPATKLDLVIREQTLQQALEQVAQAAKVKLTILPGSLEDATVLADVPMVRVQYLDLRHATLAQALDWLLQPAHLQWSFDKGTISVASARRLPGDSPWVYQVGELMLPTNEETKGKDAAEVRKSAITSFIADLRLLTGQAEETGVKSGSSKSAEWRKYPGLRWAGHPCRYCRDAGGVER